MLMFRQPAGGLIRLCQTVFRMPMASGQNPRGSFRYAGAFRKMAVCRSVSVSRYSIQSHGYVLPAPPLRSSAF